MAIAGVQGGRAVGLIDVSGRRLLADGLPGLAIVVGGLMFAVGMVLTRGCVSRLTVLSATGNLRAWTVLAIFAIVALATIKGVFAPVRVALGSVQVDLGLTLLADVSGVAVTLPWTDTLFLGAGVSIDPGGLWHRVDSRRAFGCVCLCRAAR